MSDLDRILIVICSIAFISVLSLLIWVAYTWKPV
jgi:hypothetical protein